MNTESILKSDKMINNIVVCRKITDNSIYQSEMEKETITKHVYKEHNEVFNVNRAIKEAPKCKCVFTLHTDKKSSYVQVFDRENKEIFSGNSLWNNLKHDSYDEHLDFIKMLHSIEDVKQKYDC